MWRAVGHPHEMIANGGKPEMPLPGFALFGAVIGAAGTEFLRIRRPELVDRIEAFARKFTAQFISSKSAEAPPKD